MVHDECNENVEMSKPLELLVVAEALESITFNGEGVDEDVETQESDENEWI